MLRYESCHSYGCRNAISDPISNNSYLLESKTSMWKGVIGELVGSKCVGGWGGKGEGTGKQNMHPVSFCSCLGICLRRRLAFLQACPYKFDSMATSFDDEHMWHSAILASEDLDRELSPHLRNLDSFYSFNSLRLNN